MQRVSARRTAVWPNSGAEEPRLRRVVSTVGHLALRACWKGWRPQSRPSLVWTREVELTSPGWRRAFGCAVLMLLVNAATRCAVSVASSGLGRNHAAGVRLPSFIRSEEDWQIGHLAVRRVTLPFLIASGMIAVVPRLGRSAEVTTAAPCPWTHADRATGFGQAPREQTTEHSD